MDISKMKDIMTQNYDGLLMDYASGALGEAESVVISAHLTLSPFARRIVNECETIGGALLESGCAPVRMKSGSLDDVLNRLSEADSTVQEKPKKRQDQEGVLSIGTVTLPKVLSRYMKPDLNEEEWRVVYPGMKTYQLDIACKKTKTKLLKVEPGVKTPEHSHAGTEITLVLDGSLQDETGTYTRGDLIVLDESITHTPIADQKLGCLCLTVTSAPIRLTGWMGKFINPFLRN